MDADDSSTLISSSRIFKLFIVREGTTIVCFTLVAPIANWKRTNGSFRTQTSLPREFATVVHNKNLFLTNSITLHLETNVLLSLIYESILLPPQGWAINVLGMTVPQ